MTEIDPKKPPPLPPVGSPPTEGNPASSWEAAAQDPHPASPIFDILDPAPVATPTVPAAPENLVAEIVDQITQKQARAARRPEPALAGAEVCGFCLEEPAGAGSPYRVVLKCTSGEPDPV